MYDDHFEQFERHFDGFRDRVSRGAYEAMMNGEDGDEGSLPMDCQSCQPQLSTDLFHHNVFGNDWTDEDLFVSNEE